MFKVLLTSDIKCVLAKLWIALDQFMDKLKYGNDVTNAYEQEVGQLYKTCYGVSCKILRLPQAVAVILFKPKGQEESRPFGVLYQSLSLRNIHGYDAEVPEWINVNDVNVIHESTSVSKVSQSLLQQHPELLSRCEELLTEDVELKVSILGCHTLDVLWHDMNSVILQSPIQQITFFPFNTETGTAYLAVLQKGPLLPIFQQSIKLMIQKPLVGGADSLYSGFNQKMNPSCGMPESA